MAPLISLPSPVALQTALELQEARTEHSFLTGEIAIMSKVLMLRDESLALLRRARQVRKRAGLGCLLAQEQTGYAQCVLEAVGAVWEKDGNMNSRPTGDERQGMQLTT